MYVIVAALFILMMLAVVGGLIFLLIGELWRSLRNTRVGRNLTAAYNWTARELYFFFYRPGRRDAGKKIRTMLDTKKPNRLVGE